MKFVSEFSLLWLLPIVLLAFGLTWYYYKNQSWLKEISTWIKRTLFFLRFASLVLISFLLLDVLFNAVSYRIEKPIFISLIDNSKSLKNYKDSNDILTQITRFQSELKEKYGNKFDLVTYTVGERTNVSDSVSLSESKSNLSEGFQEIFSKYYNRNVGGIVFISDGNYNEGSNPIYTAEQISLTPIFTLGVGDTISKKDQLIRDVSANEIAFLKNKFPIEVDVESFKMGKVNSTVSIIHKGKVLDSKTIFFDNGTYDFKHLSFELEANEIGFQQYIIELKSLDGEYSYKNNRRTIYIEVLDARNKVLLLAGAPHPDISALKFVLDKDENMEVVSKTTEDWDKNVSNLDFIIWHEPGVNLNASVLDAIQNSNKPILYILGPNTNNSIIQKLNIGFTIGNGSQTDEVQASFNKGFESFEISEELQSSIKNFPPLKVRFGETKLNTSSKVMIYQKLGDFTKKDPLIFFGENQKQKYGVVFGEGIWRWKLFEYQKSKSNKHFEELFQKINQYLIVKQNSSSLRIIMPRRFSVSDELKIKAEFYNEALELTVKPKISFLLVDEEGKSSTYEFAVTGNSYNLPLGTLKPGKYTWIASSNYASKKHEKKGFFIIEDLDIESINTKANHQVLRQISSQSSGTYHDLKNYEKLVEEIGNREDISEMSYKENSYNNLLDYLWVLLLIIVLLSTEWFLRRYNGNY
jgi:hypothetical protein